MYLAINKVNNTFRVRLIRLLKNRRGLEDLFLLSNKKKKDLEKIKSDRFYTELYL